MSENKQYSVTMPLKHFNLDDITHPLNMLGGWAISHDRGMFIPDGHVLLRKGKQVAVMDGETPAQIFFNELRYASKYLCDIWEATLDGNDR